MTKRDLGQSILKTTLLAFSLSKQLIMTVDVC